MSEKKPLIEQGMNPKWFRMFNFQNHWINNERRWIPACAGMTL
jgi:hypothetical protein